MKQTPVLAFLITQRSVGELVLIAFPKNTTTHSAQYVPSIGIEPET